MRAMNFISELILLLLTCTVALTQQDGQPQSQQMDQQFATEQLPLPPFLSNASEEAKRQFFSIAYNANLRIAQINAQLEQWAKEQPKDVQDAFNAQLSMQKQTEAWLNEERDKLLNALPADAKALAMKLDAIRENLQLTPNEQMKQVFTCINVCSIDDLKSEIKVKRNTANVGGIMRENRKNCRNSKKKKRV
uniref:DUF148 domain-containing protein n=1 Tax=Parascaris univalens TaxID=6257 RepID=A0A914ZP86_PARUN